MEMFTMIAYALVSMAVSYVISAAMAPKPVPPEAAGIKDFDFPQVDEGTSQAVIFGDCWSGDWCILGLGNFSTSAIKKSGGGKK